MVPLELGDEAPVVQVFGFLEEGGEGLGIGREDVDEPRQEGIRHGLPMVGGGGIEFVGVDRVGRSPKASQCVGAVRGALDVRRHHLIPVRPRNEETRELIVVDPVVFTRKVSDFLCYYNTRIVVSTIFSMTFCCPKW